MFLFASDPLKWWEHFLSTTLHCEAKLAYLLPLGFARQDIMHIMRLLFLEYMFISTTLRPSLFWLLGISHGDSVRPYRMVTVYVRTIPPHVFGSRSRRFERNKIVSSPSTCES